MSGWQEQQLHRSILAESDICYLCGKPGADMVDDVIPLSEGGQPTRANKKPAHADPCHAKKVQAEAARGRARTNPRT